MEQPEHVLVVGAGLAGLRTAEQLRAAGHEGRISLVGAEPHLPYDRPPLSKQLLTGEWEPDRLRLRDADALDELGVRLHLGLAATALVHHGDAVEVQLADGATLHGDVAVLATGVAARRLPGQPDTARTLRTLDDALVLRDTLGSIGSLLIVGGGFVGAEVASAAVRAGVAVTVLEALDVPTARTLGPVAGALAGRLMREAGVDLRTGARLAGFRPDGVELADGSTVHADAVLVGVGGVPRTDLLPGAGPDGSPLDVADGVACGPTGRVHGLPGVWAVGDVACWAGRRTEHWTNAGAQAAAVAADVLGTDAPPAAVPYFWSDQFGLKIQLIGRTVHTRPGPPSSALPSPGGADDVIALHGSGMDGGPVRGTVLAHLRGDDLLGVTGFGAARHVARYRALIGGRRADALALAATL